MPKIMRRGIFLFMQSLLLVLLVSRPAPAVAQVTTDLPAQSPELEPMPACVLGQRLLGVLHEQHVSPPVNDSIFSQKLQGQLLHHLDPQGLILTQADADTIKALFQQGTSAVSDPDCHALARIMEIYRKQYLLVDSLRSKLLQQPITFAEDTLLLSLSAKASYAADYASLVDRWRKQLAYMVLYEAYTDAGDQPLQLTKEASYRQQVQSRLQCRRQKMLQTPAGIKDFVSDQYLQAIATAFDPHTNYLPPASKDLFVASLSVEAVSFGIELEENHQGDIQIARLAPGGPAWKSRELHVGDVLLALRSKTGVERDFACLDLEEADEILADANFHHAFLTVRKKSGRTRTVELIKEKLQVEENTVNSFLLKGDQLFGYLNLPAFFTQMDGPGDAGAAQQVAREVMKLKRAGVEGLILDLRYNGGGSVLEALKLAALFIDKGPLGLEVSRGETPHLIEDMYEGVFYQGPMLLLVNGLTASAAEILAMALQDYNRALIVGSTTYGKATIQIMTPLANEDQEKEVAAGPFAKVTIGRYYGVKAKSYQAIGIVPDVALQDGLAAFEMAEVNHPTALKADVIEREITYGALAPMPLAFLQAQSHRRLQSDKAYQAQKLRTDTLLWASKQGFPVRLHPLYFQQDYKQLLALTDLETVGMAKQLELPFKLADLPSGYKFFRRNSVLMENNKRLRKELSGDVWLAEAYRIMQNLLEAEMKSATR